MITPRRQLKINEEDEEKLPARTRSLTMHELEQELRAAACIWPRKASSDPSYWLNHSYRRDRHQTPEVPIKSKFTRVSLHPNKSTEFVKMPTVCSSVPPMMNWKDPEIKLRYCSSEGFLSGRFVAQDVTLMRPCYTVKACTSERRLLGMFPESSSVPTNTMTVLPSASEVALSLRTTDLDSLKCETPSSLCTNTGSPELVKLPAIGASRGSVGSLQSQTSQSDMSSNVSLQQDLSKQSGIAKAPKTGTEPFQYSSREGSVSPALSVESDEKSSRSSSPAESVSTASSSNSPEPPRPKGDTWEGWKTSQHATAYVHSKFSEVVLKIPHIKIMVSK